MQRFATRQFLGMVGTKLSQGVRIEEQAEGVGICPQQFRKLMGGGVADPRLSTVAGMSAYYGCPIDALVEVVE